MSDDTPAGPSDSAEPSVPPAGSPEPPTQPQPPGDAPVSEPVTAQAVDTPTTEEPPTEADAPTVAAPASASETVSDAAPGAPAPAAPATAPAGGGRRGVFVPAWIAAVVGILLVAGLGFAIGWAVADDDGNPSNAVATSPDTSANRQPNGNGNDGDSDRGLPFPGRDDDDDDDDNPLFSRAYLGVTVGSAENDGGATVRQVADDSPAAEAGLQADDVITAVDDTEISSALDLIRAITEHEVDDTVTITYTRNGTSAQAEVTLSDRPTPSAVS